MLRTSYNRLVIEVEKQFEDLLTYLSGVKLYIDTRFNPEEKVALTGKVHSVPISMRDVPGAAGLNFGSIEVGDTVMLRYDVLSATRDQPDRDSVRYRNEIWVDGKQFWFADVEQVFAVLRGDDWETINDYVILEKLIVDRGLYYDKTKIIRPESYQKAEQKNLGCVIASARIPVGTAVWFDQRLAQKYSLNGKPVFIIKDRYIPGRSEKKSISVSEKE